MRWLVRFGYDGVPFFGWARQPGLRTVEGEILRGVVERGLALSSQRPGIEVASRTDRGVSAVGNAMALSSERSGSVLLRALNGISPEMFFTAAKPIPESFRVRGASRRVYRYFEPAGDHDLERWRSAARLFQGQVDVRSFGRGLPAGEPARRTIEGVEVQRVRDTFLVEARAPSFVWGMVRKIVAALREVDSGGLSEDRLAEALAGRVRLTLPMAEPERLLLWEVEYPGTWSVHWSGPTRRQERWWKSSREAATVRMSILDAVASGPGRSRGEPS